MTLFVISLGMLAVLTYVLYTMINFKQTIANLRDRVEGLQSLVDQQQDETRALITAYMTESRVISFYDDVSPLIQDEEIKKMFGKLAKDEEKHIMLLENCFARKTKN